MSNAQMYSELNPLIASIANQIRSSGANNEIDEKIGQLSASIEKWENFKSDDVMWTGGAGNRKQFLKSCKEILAAAKAGRLR